MGDRWNYQPNRAPHTEPAFKEWSYNGYQQPPPDYFNHNQFGVPMQHYGGRGGHASNHSGHMQMQHCPQQISGFSLNPNAAAFIPRGYAQASNAMHFLRNGADKQMKRKRAVEFVGFSGCSRRGPDQWGRLYGADPAGELEQSGPAMSFYSGDDADVRAYEAMYNQFPNGGVLEEYIPSQELHHDMVTSDNLVSLQEIQVGLEQILSDTDDFDSWAGAIRDRMTEKRMSAPTRVVAVHMIFEMAVSVAPRPLSGNNPQHTLARLLNFLCTEGNGGRIDKVGEALLEQLDDLLKLEMCDSLMKTVVQLVKLCGRHLDASSATEPLVNQLLTKLIAFAKGHPQLSETVKTQIMSLVELRKNSWGGNGRGGGGFSDAYPSSSSRSMQRSDSGLIVGEDGVALELNEEERSFLESQFSAMDGLDDDHDQSFDDQEVLKDFGDFVKEEEERKTNSMLEKLKVCDQEK
ncbi:unnamed protein product [Heligmosomoides polygyrus]|uniref:Polyadenylate-binding protein-interacting protein 1 n=1 Tax=Heligmosomoides polygyrus TaxID=6339 RepID=A0A3P8AKL5_HELPZ|nr:unnamed protein product [Heligmosomoides polygyrus]